jgi:MFS transporter, CP family, cyanate transporter
MIRNQASTAAERKPSTAWGLSLISLAAFNLRTTILSVPPVLPLMHHELGFDYIYAGLLASMPVIALAIGVVPGALLANRFGARAAIGLGLLGLGFGGLARLLDPPGFWLLAGTAALSLGSAAAQPGIAAAIVAWFPNSLQRASALSTSLLYTGGIVAVSLTVFLLPFGGWRGTLAIWSVPALVAGILWLLSPFPTRRAPGAGIPWRALHPSSSTWVAIGLFGTSTLAYYVATSWIPFTFEASGTWYVAFVLGAINFIQIPASLALAMLKGTWVTARSFYAISGFATMLSGIGFVVLPSNMVWVAALVFGLSGALIASGALALPIVLAKSEGEAAANMALVLALGYVITLGGPLLGSVLLEATGMRTAALWPMTIATVASLVIGLLVPTSWRARHKIGPS